MNVQVTNDDSITAIDWKGTIIMAVSLVLLSAANCWIVQFPFPIYKIFSGDSRVWNSIPYLDRAIESDPYNWKNYYQRGRAYEKFRYYQLALNDYDKTAKLNPDNVHNIEHRACVQYYAGNFLKALADRNWVMSARGACSEDYADRSRILEQLNKSDSALTDARTAVYLKPSSAGAHLALAYACLRINNLQEALHECRMAQVLSPADSRFAAKLCEAQVLIAQEQWSQSINLCNEALKQNPDGWNALWIKALAQYNLGEYNQAVRNATASICLNPMQATPYLIRAESHNKLNRYIDAAKDRNTAKKLDANLEHLRDICNRVIP